MSQQQGQYLGLVNELSTEASLQLRGSEQKLLTACQMFSSECSILLILSDTECERAWFPCSRRSSRRMDSKKAGSDDASFCKEFGSTQCSAPGVLCAQKKTEEMRLLINPVRAPRTKGLCLCLLTQISTGTWGAEWLQQGRP
jgi:hypothetical protein